MAEKYYQGFGSFPQFWYFYLSQHMKTGTRAVHYVGTWAIWVALALAAVGPMIASTGFLASAARWWLVPGALLYMYVTAFISHWTIEKNQPATFIYPLLSVGGDLKMFGLGNLGRLRPHVETVRTRIAQGWVVNRYGFYPPEYAASRGIKHDVKVAPFAATA